MNSEFNVNPIFPDYKSQMYSLLKNLTNTAKSKLGTISLHEVYHAFHPLSMVLGIEFRVSCRVGKCPNPGLCLKHTSFSVTEFCGKLWALVLVLNTYH